MPETLKKPRITALAARPAEKLIHITRGRKVMLDADLAMLYQVPTKRLNEAVRRNRERFPEDFMFQLTGKEAMIMRSQIATASKRNIKYQPLAFTEHGVAMLSAVLHSARAVRMSIDIIRAFVRLRELIAHNKDLAVRVEKLERNYDNSNSVIEVIVEDIDRLAHDVERIKNPPLAPKRKIGYIFHEG